MAHAENSAKTARGNPDKIKPYRWKKGIPSPNPGGRPKKLITDHALTKLLARDEKEAKAVAVAMIRQAKKSPRGLSELLDRIEGKVPQAHQHSGAGGEPIQVEIIRVGAGHARALSEDGKD